ncbi:MAG: serine hydrolase [Clostridia bacterium]|nr:serine hydrolase [Clostridia bacterium]
MLSVILLVSLLAVFTAGAGADYYNSRIADKLNAKAYLLYNTDTDIMVFSSGADELLQSGSLVKLTTALVVMEHCSDLSENIAVSYDAIAYVSGYTCGLSEGEVISVENLLYCMLVDSANDAANVLAVHFGGSVSGFVKMMDNYAASIGCTSTVYGNPSGLDDPGHHTTANDVLKIARKVIENEVLFKMTDTVEYIVPATNKHAERKLSTNLSIIDSGSYTYYYKYAHGLKYGNTDAALNCAVSLATYNGYTYIGVILGAPRADYNNDGANDKTALFELTRMFKWAFSNMKLMVVADTSTIIKDVPVLLSAQTDHVRLVPRQEVTALLMDDVDSASFAYECDVNPEIKAPVSKGDVMGSAKIKYAGDTIADVVLVAGESVKRSTSMYVAYCLKKLFTSVWFYGIIVAGALTVVVVVTLRKRKY